MAAYAEAVAHNVRLLRAAQRMSARALGEQCGLPRNTITNLENGRKADVSISEVVALAGSLGVAPLDLLSIAGDSTWFSGPVFTRESVVSRLDSALRTT